MKPCKPGWYWVQDTLYNCLVARWEFKRWLVCGVTASFKADHFLNIGPRIEPPKNYGGSRRRVKTSMARDVPVR